MDKSAEFYPHGSKTTEPFKKWGPRKRVLPTNPPGLEEPFKRKGWGGSAPMYIYPTETPEVEDEEI